MQLDEDDRAETTGANPDELSMASFVRRILVPADFSDGAKGALTLAIKFAKLLRAATARDPVNHGLQPCL